MIVGLKIRIYSFYKKVDHFFQEQEGLYGSKAFMAAMNIWPVCTAAIFGSYFYSGDRRPLGDYEWVWESGRIGIVIMSILCLIFYHWAFMREMLGHSIFLYAALATMSYWYAVPNHDRAFQGDLIRVVASSIAFYIMTMMSYALLREKRKWETHQSIQGS